MNSRFRRVVVGAVTAAAVVVFFTTAVRALYLTSEKELSTQEAAALVHIDPERIDPLSADAEVGVPIRLAIPSIAVDARVTDVGIGTSGNMAVPRAYSDVGWYRYGPRPGEQGSAVIDGHVDNGFGLGAVFRRLGELTVGDRVHIYDTDGTHIEFIVTDVQSYPWQEVPLDLVFNRKNGSYLNLITCDGAWSLASMTYDKRLVVFAKRVS